MTELAINIVDLLDRYVKPQSLAILNKCLENAIFMKIKYRHDIIQFLTYVSQEYPGVRSPWRSHATRSVVRSPTDATRSVVRSPTDATRSVVQIDNIINKINKIIKSESSNYEALIEDIFDNHLGQLIRFKYSMYIILPYVQKLLNLPSMEQLKRDIDLINTEAPASAHAEDSLNDVFKKHTGRDYNYFQERYDRVVGNSQVIRLFNKWKAPKFVILPYLRNAKQRTPPKAQATIIGGTDEATLPLRKMHRNVVQSTDKILQADKDKIMRILNNDGVTAQSFWENNMYEYIRKHNKHPRTEDRNALIVVTCWIYKISHGDAKSNLKDLINTANHIGYETGSTAQSADATGGRIAYAMGLYNEMFTGANASIYKKSFMANFSSYPIPIEKIKQFLGSKLESIESIENIIYTLNSYPPPKSKKEREDMVYKLLKPIKQLGITKKIIQSFT